MVQSRRAGAERICRSRHARPALALLARNLADRCKQSADARKRNRETNRSNAAAGRTSRGRTTCADKLHHQHRRRTASDSNQQSNRAEVRYAKSEDCAAAGAVEKAEFY